LGCVIPGWSEGPDPESRESGFDAAHRPGMTNEKSASNNFPLLSGVHFAAMAPP
jgi:hypothetical protein